MTNKSRTLRKAGAVALSLAMAMSIVGVTPASAAAKKVTLSKAKGTIKVGKTATVKIQGTKKANIKKVTFKYTKKNIAKATRKNLKIKITGLKAGKTTVKAVVKLKKKVGTKKKYTLKYVATVKKAATTPTTAPEETTTPTTEPTATPVAELAITAEQTGASTFKLTANQEVGASDTIKVVRGTSIAQTIGTTVWNDAKTEATVTLGSKIGDSEYTVTLTPADASKKAATCTFTGKTAALKSIDFKGTNLVLTDSQMTKGAILIFGYNDFNEEISLADISVYPSKGTAAYSAKDNKIIITGPTMGKDAYNNDIYQPFTIGEKINVNVVYQDNGTVLQKNAELTVAERAAVKELTFGELKTSDATLKDKKVTLSNIAGGTYYKEVTAVDQYGTALTADDLKGMVWSTTNTNGTLYINPTAAGGQYVYFDGFDTAADKKTVIAKFKGGDIGIPGKGIVSFNSVGGANVTTEIEVVDDPYIDTLNVSVPSDVYAGTEVELSVDAKDQDGNALDLYKYATANKPFDTAYAFPEGQNHTNKQVATITCSAGEIKVVRNTTKKTVSFKYKYTAAGTETFPVNAILTVKSAKVAVNTVSVKVQKAGEIAGIQGLTSDTKTTYEAGKAISIDLKKKLVFKDNYGGTVANAAEKNDASKYPVFVAGAGSTTAPIATNKPATASGTNTLYEYTIKDKDGKYLALGGNNDPEITLVGEYTVELFKYVGTASSAGNDSTNNDAGRTVTSLGTFKFTVSQSNGKYKAGSFKASIKAGQELLYTGHQATGTDSAEIVLTATDEKGVTASIDRKVSGTDVWTVTLSDTRFEDVAATNADSAKVQLTSSAASGGRLAGDTTKAASSGKVTADVWYAGDVVASVDIPYSDADPEGKSFTWKLTTAATGVTSDAADEISISGFNNLDVSTAEVVQIEEDGNNDGNVDKTYKMTAVDQYGVAIALKTTLNGVVVSGGTNILGAGTLRVQAGTLSKDITISGEAVASMIAGAGSAAVSSTCGSNTTLTGVTLKDQFGKIVKNATLTTSDFTAGTSGVTGVALSSDSDGVLVVKCTGAYSADTTFTCKVLGKTAEFEITGSQSKIQLNSWS